MTKPDPQPASLNFQLTDFEDARATLDQPPPGIKPPPDEASYWESKRAPPVLTDRVLVSGAMQWVMSLPPSVRPAKLSVRYPRIVNALAHNSLNPDRYATLLDGMINDRREGRKGFPPEIRAELLRLEEHRPK